MGTEKCPFCGQEIDAEATRCFFCGSDLNEESVEKRLEKLQGQRYIESVRKVHIPVVLGLLVVIIFVCAVLFHAPPGRKRSLVSKDLSGSSTTRLNANVLFTGAKFLISNKDSFDWENVRLEIVSGTLGSGFSLKIPKISAGETFKVSASEFTKKDGTRFNPYAMKLQRFWIQCETPSSQNASYIAGWK